MKYLYITTIGSTMNFFKSFVHELIEKGNIVDVATNEEEYRVDECYKTWGCKVYHIDCVRSPLKSGNVKAVKQIRKIVGEGKYDIVHCHTPIASFCARLACKPLRKNGVKVVYTAHGFHFYKGAPLKNWLIFYPLEKLCSHWTDVLITINKEDFDLANSRMKTKRVEYIPGVGINVDRFRNTVIDREKKRKELSIPEDAFLLLSVGELNCNKNHKVVIEALAKLQNPDYHYCIAGNGAEKENLEALARNLGIERQVHLLGYRYDTAELYKAADLYVLPSIREGLNVSVMEAMAGGLPCIVSRIRGNVDMVPEKYCFDPKSADELTVLLKETIQLDDSFVKKADCRIINRKTEKAIE